MLGIIEAHSLPAAVGIKISATQGEAMKNSQATALVLVVAAAGAVLLFAHFHGGLVGHASSPHSVTLHWSPSAGATSYNVYRSLTSGGPYTKIGTTAPPTFTDTDVSRGAVFYYVVTAVRNGKESGHSQQIKAAVP